MGVGSLNAVGVLSPARREHFAFARATLCGRCEVSDCFGLRAGAPFEKALDVRDYAGAHAWFVLC